ncbi:hypothetical protein J6590_023626 [Homalodisca vitripennis]|nr:hypothetical protein J6590_023626 [Homalodisca vitripennis]
MAFNKRRNLSTLFSVNSFLFVLFTNGKSDRSRHSSVVTHLTRALDKVPDTVVSPLYQMPLDLPLKKGLVFVFIESGRPFKYIGFIRIHRTPWNIPLRSTVPRGIEAGIRSLLNTNSFTRQFHFALHRDNYPLNEKSQPHDDAARRYALDSNNLGPVGKEACRNDHDPHQETVEGGWMDMIDGTPRCYGLRVKVFGHHGEERGNIRLRKSLEDLSPRQGKAGHATEE